MDDWATSCAIRVAAGNGQVTAIRPVDVAWRCEASSPMATGQGLGSLLLLLRKFTPTASFSRETRGCPCLIDGARRSMLGAERLDRI
jgi:hypothetical protein